MARKKKTEIDKELSLEEAQNVIKRLAHPKHVNQEEKLLKEAAAVVLKETQPEFEFGDDEDEEIKIDSASVDTTTSELTKPAGFLEQMGSQIAAIGPAGVIALSSAAYFQIDTVVEETRVVQQVAEEKWEEVKFEHPNINWDDPLAGFTTIIGVGDIDIDLDPPTPPPPSTQPTTTPPNDEPIIEEEENEESEQPQEETSEEPVEEKEEPKKKKKKLFGLFGGDDEEEEEKEEEAEEETEEPVEETEEEQVEEEEVEEPAEESEESQEPEPEAEEEQVEEKPKKKSGGLFSGLFGGGDDESDEPEDEQKGEPTQDGDTIPDEQAEETTDTESEAKANDSEVEGGEPSAEPAEGTNVAESNGVEKKSSGGGLLSLFGFNNSEEEVVEESEISTDEEPVIEIAEIDSESEAPPISDEEPEIFIEPEPMDSFDDIKPHSMVADTEVEVQEPEINIADILVNADVAIDDVEVNTGIEIDAIENSIEKVTTPNNGRVVSPSSSNGEELPEGFTLDDLHNLFHDSLGPSAPGYLDGSESDATPV